MLARRGFLMWLGSLVAAPAIVRAASLMPVKAIVVPAKHEFIFRTSLPQATWRMIHDGSINKNFENLLFNDLFETMSGMVTDDPLSSHYDLVTQNA